MLNRPSLIIVDSATISEEQFKFFSIEIGFLLEAVTVIVINASL
jgi:hypothetical protein